MDRSHKKHSDDGYDFTSKKIKQEGELEVTGVSRSGRVRKKSSKLTDFESLDEIDIRTNSRIKKEKAETVPITAVPRSIKKERILKEEVLSDVDEGNYQIKQDEFSDESENDGYGHNDDSSMDSQGSEPDEGDDDELEREDDTVFQQIVGDDSSDETSQRGLYRNDKNHKKKLYIKDGKIIGKTKTPVKKDKGNWKARPKPTPLVKRLQGNITQRPVITQTTALQDQQLNASQIRKTKTSPTRRFIPKPSSHQQQQQHVNQQHSLQQVVAVTPSTQMLTTPTPSIIATDIKSQPKTGVSTEGSVFKPVSTNALDIAAHLKLLGESLTIIGERLTEHEGQIAVSGSFCLLLDSLLCALGPLLCLTQQVPQMNVVPQEQLSQIMDNIAYIMPGL